MPDRPPITDRPSHYGRRVLCQNDIDTIRRLYQDGLSMRKIAIMVAVHRDTVSSIINDVYVVPIENGSKPEPDSDDPDADIRYRYAPKVRCPGCGGLIIRQPCILCRVRRLKQEEKNGKKTGSTNL